MEKTQTAYQIVRRCTGLILIVVTLLALGGRINSAAANSVPVPIHLSLPEDRPAMQTEAVTGITSTVLDCLTARDSSQIEYSILGQETGCGDSGTVSLHWQGRIDRARLVYSVGRLGAPPRAAHTILVNSQPAASAVPAVEPVAAEGPDYFYLEIPSTLVVQGENTIQITDDVLSGDRWTATHLRIQIFGQFESITATEGTGVQPGIPGGQGGLAPNELSASATVTLVTFRNPYDSTNQDALIQVPSGYNPGTAVPLLLFAHGRTGVMEYGIDYLGDAADAQGWLLASPEMHGSWDVPASCRNDPDSCSPDDRTLLTKPGAYAHASLESQYDLIGLAQWINARYNIDHSQIYIVGGSMGGQIATVTAAKFPHMFAAIYAYKSITDLEQWYDQVGPYERTTLEKECHIRGDPKTPDENPFCYERRSSVNFARNYVHVPISMSHSIADTLVPIAHSRNLRTAINNFGPTIPVVLYEDRTANWRCDPPEYHCLTPNPSAVLRYLAPFTRNSDPDHIRIATDESKEFYWMNVSQISGDRWSYIEAIREPDSPSLRVITNDTHAVRVGLNLGSEPIRDYVTRQPGLGFPSTTYLVTGAGHNELVNYSSGYLNTQVNTTGQSVFTVSAIEVNVVADPADVPSDQPHVSTITVQVQDQSDQANRVPNGTIVRLETTEGLFANGLRTMSLSTTDGRATTTITVQPTDNLAVITATVGMASGTATVNVERTAIRLEFVPANPVVYASIPQQYEYRVTNQGDSTLRSVVVRDDNGSGGGYNYTVCQGITLNPGQATTCPRTVTIARTKTFRAQAIGVSPTGDTVNDSASATISVIEPVIVLTSYPNPLFIVEGQSAELTYQVTNASDGILAHVTVEDNYGGGGPLPGCSDYTLAPGATFTCRRQVQWGQATTIRGTVNGQDWEGNPVTAQVQTTVLTGAQTWLPYVVRSY